MRNSLGSPQRTWFLNASEGNSSCIHLRKFLMWVSIPHVSPAIWDYLHREIECNAVPKLMWKLGTQVYAMHSHVWSSQYLMRISHIGNTAPVLVILQMYSAGKCSNTWEILPMDGNFLEFRNLQCPLDLTWAQLCFECWFSSYYSSYIVLDASHVLQHSCNASFHSNFLTFWSFPQSLGNSSKCGHF